MMNPQFELPTDNMKEKQGSTTHNVKMSPVDLIRVKDYVFHSTSIIGRGKMSMVYKAVDMRTNEIIAIKKVSKKTLNSEYLVNSLLNEISIHTKVNHPNIIKLKDVIRSNNSIYLVLEHANNGNLRDYMKAKGKLSEKEAKNIMLQIIEGMDSLIQSNILHRDVKPENILLHSTKEGTTFKICDFGFSKKLVEKDVLLQSAIGSPQYMDLQRLSSEGYSTKSDVFSLGIIAYEMVFGCPPWKANNWHDLKCDLMSKPLTIPKDVVSKEMEAFLVKTLAILESDRASWDELKALTKPWKV